jgi:predicted ATP-grasp superfamily ATP-dependent carboligase
MKYEILLLDGGGTQILPIAETLFKKGYIVHAFCTKRLSYVFWSRYIKYKKNIANTVENENSYFLYLKEYIIKNQIITIIPLDDNSSSLLSKYKSELSEYSKILIPDYEFFERGYNKEKLMAICAKYNYPHPKTIHLNDTASIDNSIFPALIKPNITCGARGLTLVNNLQEFETMYPKIKLQYGECTLQEFIQPGGAQVEVQVLVGKNNELLFSSVIYKYRWYPEKAGSSCCAVSVKNNEIVDICYNLMLSLGWQGFADFDTIEDPKDGKLKIMELNPRVPACVKAVIKSGMDWGNILVDESLDNPHKKYDYVVGKKLRHIGFEVLWFFYSKNRFKTKPNWFNFFCRNLYFQDFSWSDPLPFFFGILGNIKQQFNPQFRKSKSGMKK